MINIINSQNAMQPITPTNFLYNVLEILDVFRSNTRI